MNEEPQDWFKTLETAAQDFEQFMKETAEAFAETAELMMQVPIALAEQVEEAIATEVDSFIDAVDEWLWPSVQMSVWIDVDWNADGFEPWTEYVEPGTGQQAACVGCQHYHGRVYQGNLLVCGMHPYGWEGSECPDWEGKAT